MPATHTNHDDHNYRADKYVESVRDTDAHTYGIHFARGAVETLAKVVNTLNVAIVVSLRGTTIDDTGFAKYDTEVASVTVAAGATETLVSETPYAMYQVVGQCGSSPASGNVEVVFQSARQAR